MRPTRNMTGRRWRTRYGTVAIAVLTLGVASACSTARRQQQQLRVVILVVGGVVVRRRRRPASRGTRRSTPAARRTRRQSNWNPLDTGNFATGTQGLIYEPLFLYDPIRRARTTRGWRPATSTPAGRATPTSSTSAPGVKWSDGQALTGADVAYSINLAPGRTLPTRTRPTSSTVANATASGNTVTVTFKGTPGYTEFTDYLWKAPVLPQHVWSKFPASQIATDANAHPVGTGPMTLDTYNAQEVAYQTKPGWWATSALGLSFKFKYLVDVVNGSNDQELGQLTAGPDRLAQQLPARHQPADGRRGRQLRLHPQDLLPDDAVHAVGEHGVARAEQLRRADEQRQLPQGAGLRAQPVGDRADRVRRHRQGGQPDRPAAHLSSYVNQGAVSSGAPTYNPAKAKQFLAQSGYKGQAITLQVPQGWSDWMDATTVIKSELDAVGINLQLIYPQANARTSNVTNGNFDLQLDNNAGLDSTPWSYYQRVYQLPIAKQQTSQLNWERYQLAGGLVAGAAGAPRSRSPTPLSWTPSTPSCRRTSSQQQPVIPLWYNGIWFQGNTQYWQDFPSSAGSRPEHARPCGTATSAR